MDPHLLQKLQRSLYSWSRFKHFFSWLLFLIFCSHELQFGLQTNRHRLVVLTFLQREQLLRFNRLLQVFIDSVRVVVNKIWVSNEKLGLGQLYFSLSKDSVTNMFVLKTVYLFKKPERGLEAFSYFLILISEVGNLDLAKLPRQQFERGSWPETLLPVTQTWRNQVRWTGIVLVE